MMRGVPFRGLAGQAPPWARYRRTGLGALGDISSIVSQLSQYGSDEILSAYNWLYQTYQSESQDLTAMTQWASPAAGNVQYLSAADRQAYISALNDQTTVVNNLNDWVSQAQSVLQVMGIHGAPGLSGTGRRMGRLGVFPVIAAGVILAIIALIAGVTISVVAYNQRLSVQAHEATLQIQSKTQASIAQSMQAAGATPDQIQKALNDSYKAQADQNKQSFASQIPWTTLGIVAGVVFVAKSIFE